MKIVRTGSLCRSLEADGNLQNSGGIVAVGIRADNALCTNTLLPSIVRQSKVVPNRYE